MAFPLVLLVALLVAGSALGSMTTIATCNVGPSTITDPTSCLIASGLPPPNYYFQDSHAQATASEGFTASVDTSAEAEVQFFAHLSSIYGEAFAGGTTVFSSIGPRRLGTIHLNTYVYQHSNVAPVLTISDGVHIYSYGDSCANGGTQGCYQDQTLPFYLGSLFYVEAISTAYTEGDVQFPSSSLSSKTANVTFSLEDGAKPVFALIVDSPEPSTAVFLIMGSLLISGVLLTNTEKQRLKH